MLIELQQPFKSLWNKGYIVLNNEGRKHVTLYNNKQNISGITYARYLICCHLGYILSSDYEVDHINDDKTDDRLENLQVLTKEQNRLKQYWRYIEKEQVCYGFHCAYCSIQFILTENEVNNRLYKGVEYAFCGRSCAAKYHHSIR